MALISSFTDFSGAMLITSAEDLDICDNAVAVEAEQQKFLQILSTKE